MQTHFDSTLQLDGREIAVQVTRLTRGIAIPFFTRFRHLRERTARTAAKRAALTLADADDAAFDAIQKRELEDGNAWGDYFSEAMQYVQLLPGALTDETDGTPILTGEQLMAYFASRPDVISQVVTVIRLENILTDDAKKNWKLRRASGDGSSLPLDAAPSGATPAATAAPAVSSTTAGLALVTASPALSPSGATAH